LCIHMHSVYKKFSGDARGKNFSRRTKN
jgi:hypothetical protein